jgi:hypothetical protein
MYFLFATAGFAGREKTLVNQAFLCFNLSFTNDLPIFLESQAC